MRKKVQILILNEKHHECKWLQRRKWANHDPKYEIFALKESNDKDCMHILIIRYLNYRINSKTMLNHCMFSNI